MSEHKKTRGLQEPWGSEQCPLYGDDVTISLRCKRHIRLGCWAIDTANPNCWSRAAAYLRLTTADYVDIQEMKVLEGHPAREAADAAKATKWKMPVGGCLALDGLSCGTAVAAKSHLGLGESKVIGALIDAAGIGHRLQVKHSGGIFRGGFHLGSMYCSTGVGF